MHHTHHFSNRLAITAMIAILLLPTAVSGEQPAWTGLGVHGDRGEVFGGDDRNLDNWPKGAKEMCEGALARVLKQCAEAEFENWYVRRAISGEGSYNGKSLDFDGEDIIFGPSKCPPTEDVTPAGVTARKIISEFIRYTKISTGGEGLSDDAEIRCKFACFKWECPEDYNPNKICEARIVGDFEIRQAGGVTQAIDEQIAKGKRFARESCEALGENCKIKKCEIKPIMVDETQVLRVCCDCTCPNTWFEETFEWDYWLEEYFEEQKEKQETAEGLIQRVRDHFSRLKQERENLRRVYEQQKELVEVLREKNKQCRGMVEIPPPTIEKPAVQITTPTAPSAVTCNIPMFMACADEFNPQECVNACPYVQIECPAGTPQTECKEIDKECSNQCLVKMDSHISNCLKSSHCTKEEIIAGGGAPR
ncbi:MAG TPA: hypothetical protein VI612_02020 [Candidatus Nanoarchaeia archaeon]|nr:hypothetical protein [Candidatus Nanoarchaeia archaeon]